jgi:threonine synthase
LERYLAAHPDQAGALAVSVETAHPAKFPDEIRALLGLEPAAPPALAGLDARPEQYGHLTTDYAPFRDLLQQTYGS